MTDDAPHRTAGDATGGSRTDVVAFADRLAVAVERKRSQLVVGLDPRIDLLPMELRGEAVLGCSVLVTGAVHA